MNKDLSYARVPVQSCTLVQKRIGLEDISARQQVKHQIDAQKPYLHRALPSRRRLMKETSPIALVLLTFSNTISFL